MKITKAAPSDLDEAIGCLATAFAHDPITGFLLQTGSGYRERVTQFFSMLMRARIALNMPVLLARDTAGIHGAAMGYTTESPAWPTDIADEWDRFEKANPRMTDRLADYEAITATGEPAAPHFYLGVIGVEPHSLGLAWLGLGIGGSSLIDSLHTQKNGASAPFFLSVIY